MPEEKTDQLMATDGIRNRAGQFVPGHQPLHTGFKHKASKIKESFCEVYERLGGTDGLLAWIKSERHNKREFYKMILQVLPKDIDLAGEGFGDTKIIIVRPSTEKAINDK